jgi:hypothetical protein
MLIEFKWLSYHGKLNFRISLENSHLSEQLLMPCDLVVMFIIALHVILCLTVHIIECTRVQVQYGEVYFCCVCLLVPVSEDGDALIPCLTKLMCYLRVICEATINL